MNHQITSQLQSFKSIFFLFLVALITSSLFISCEKDLVPIEDEPIEDPMDDPMDDPMEDPDIEIVISHNADLYTGSISGIVLNENEEPLADVTITVRDEAIITDENGYFNLKDIQLDATGTVLTASLDNYWTLTKMISQSKEQNNQTRILLLPKTEPKRIDAASGGMVNFSDAVKIDFPENVFTTVDGESYDGEVEISAIHLDPNDENFGMMSPGDFRAFDANSELQSLVSYGMAGVELRGENNELLELKTDMPANLYVKVPEGSNVEDMPLWHFDEASGYWLEEGSAKKEGDYYVGEVSHFSWWNCDIPFSAVKLSGAVYNTQGAGVEGLEVSIIMVDNMRNLGAEYTGSRGFFCGWIPEGVNLIIQIKNECGTVIYETEIGPFSEDTNLSGIVIDDQNIVEICGQLVDCDGALVTDGYLVVQHQETKTFIPVDANGNYCSSVNVCEATTFDLYGIDINSGLQGLASTYEVSDAPLQDLELSACDQLASIFSYQINEEDELFFTDFSVNLDDGVLYFGASTQINGIYPGGILDGQNWGTPDFTFSYFNIALITSMTEIDCDAFGCGAPGVNMIDFGGVGNPIVFEISGTSDEGDDYVIHLSGILE